MTLDTPYQWIVGDKRVAHRNDSLQKSLNWRLAIRKFVRILIQIDLFSGYSHFATRQFKRLNGDGIVVGFE